MLVYLVADTTTCSWEKYPKFIKVGLVNSSNYNKLYATTKKGAVINQGWKKPLEGCLMINVDAAYDGIKGSASSGAVIGDSTC